MNTKSILGILLVILALSLTLGAVSAEKVVADASADILSVEETTVEEVSTKSETGNTAGAHVQFNASADESVSDLAVIVTPLYDFDKINTWSILVYNYGPDTATNTQVLLSTPDNLVYYDHEAFYGTFDPLKGIWHIGDLAKDEYTQMLLAMYKVAPGPSYVEAVVVSDSYDPDLSNN